MSTQLNHIDELTTLNEIAQTLNHAVDVRGMLGDALAKLVALMGLDTGWIFLVDSQDAENGRQGSGFALAAWHNLPPVLAPDTPGLWNTSCDCQFLCTHNRLDGAYNAVRCSRLAQTHSENGGLSIHASVPLRSRERLLGILNVAGPDWEAFRPEALALLGSVASHLGIALERANLYDLLREQRGHEQVILLELSNQLLRRPDLEDLMDYLVREAARILQVDACCLLLAGSEPDSLYFQAAAGWRHDPVAAGYQLPTDRTAGPGQVMRDQRPFLIEDIRLSDAICWLPEWQQAESFRGHAVVPLVADGVSTGVLVVNTRRPGLLDADRVRLLQLMANQAAIAIETARLREQERQRQQIEIELAVARQIQLGLLPRSCPEMPGWDCATLYQAARQVGGDFYDFFDLPGEPRRVGLVIADVADKGVPAALFMALSRTAIRTAALAGRGPAEALRQANRMMLNDSPADLFVSVVYAVLDVETGRLVYANAGHNHPLWLRAAGGELVELDAPGTILGMLPDVEVGQGEIEMAPGDLLLLYTDGVTEALDGEGREFGTGRLWDVLSVAPRECAQAVLDGVVNAVEAFSGETPAADDLTLLALLRCG